MSDTKPVKISTRGGGQGCQHLEGFSNKTGKMECNQCGETLENITSDKPAAPKTAATRRKRS